MFEEEEIGGVYWKSGKNEKNETYYKKEDPARFLSKKLWREVGDISVFHQSYLISHFL